MLVILDRDGVINYDSPHYIKTPDEWLPIPGSIEAISRLSQAGHIVVVATNQSGLGRGLYSLEGLNAIHQKMLDTVEAAGGKIDKIYFCPHLPDAGCRCRKPEPGMLLDIFRDYDVLAKDCVFVGDSARDLEAADAVGCPFVLVKTGNGEKTLRELNREDVVVGSDLSFVADKIIHK